MEHRFFKIIVIPSDVTDATVTTRKQNIFHKLSDENSESHKRVLYLRCYKVLRLPLAPEDLSFTRRFFRVYEAIQNFADECINSLQRKRVYRRCH